MEIFILPGVHMSERSEFGPQNKKRQISCHEFIKQLERVNDLYSASPGKVFGDTKLVNCKV